MATRPEDDRKSAAFDRFDVLSRIGNALGRVKSARRLTLPDMADLLGRSEDQMARYIAGEEMPVSLWMKALALWPELAEKYEETSAERIFKAKQRALDLAEPKKRKKAA